jgi:hypothetical protein
MPGQASANRVMWRSENVSPEARGSSLSRYGESSGSDHRSDLTAVQQSVQRSAIARPFGYGADIRSKMGAKEHE